MRPRVPRPSGWILATAAVVLLVGPAALLWHFFHPQPLDAEHLLVQFQSVRYERAGLVFTYRLDNRTHRSARLTTDRTTIRVKQSGGQRAGFPAIHLPLEILAQSKRDVEVRLELPLPRASVDAEQTARVLEHHVPGPHDLESPLAPLPMTRPQVSNEMPRVPDLTALADLSLALIEGFELVNEQSGIRILFPRGW